MRVRHRTATVLFALATAVLIAAPSAWACGFLVAQNGAIRLEKFTALSAVGRDGRTHYVTSFAYGGSAASFGAVVPLPAEPSTVEKAGSWTLQRLAQEVAPPPPFARDGLSATAAEGATVVGTYEVEALDITVLRGGADGVLDWTDENGFDIGVRDAALPMLEFYARRSPYFAAVRYDVDRAKALDRQSGDGTPVHFVFDAAAPWVPLRVLAFDKPADERVRADVFLLTPDAPRVLTGAQVTATVSQPASAALLDDLRDDENSSWIPDTAWLTYYDVNVAAGDLAYDLAVAAPGEQTVLSSAAFGEVEQVAPAVAAVSRADRTDTIPRVIAAVSLMVALLGMWAWRRSRTRGAA